MSSQDNAAGDFTNDAHWGKGGRYVVGLNGQREPVAPAAADVAAIDQVASSEAVTTTAVAAAKTKEKKHG